MADIPQKLKRRLHVGVNGDFSTIKSAVDWFNSSATSNVELIVDGGNHLVTDTITVNNGTYNLAIRGIGSNITILQASTGLTNKPMFDIKSSCDITRLKGDGSTLTSYGTLSTENFINITQDSGVYCEFTDFRAENFYKAISEQAPIDLFVFNFVIKSCVIGIEINHSGDGFLDAEVGNIEDVDVGVDLVSATDNCFAIHSVFFFNPLGGISIRYDGDNFTCLGYSSIAGCTWNNVGSFTSGFDFKRRDGRDADILMVGNIGEEDKKAHAKINVVDNTTAVTVTTAGTYYKAADVFSVTRIIFDQAATAGTFTITVDDQTTSAIAYNATAGTIETAIEALSNVTNCTVTQIVEAKEWTIRFETAGEGWVEQSVDVSGLTTTTSVDVIKSFYTVKIKLDQNKVEYLSSQPADCRMWISGNVQVNGTNRNVTIGILENGAGQILSPMTARCATANQPYPFSIVAYVDDVGQGDYFEIYLTSSTNGDQVIIQDLNWYFEAL